MKRAMAIFVFIIIVTLVICNFMPARPYNFDDCIELGLCAEGLKLKDNGVSFIMSKNYCLKNNYVWDNENKVCNVRKFND